LSPAAQKSEPWKEKAAGGAEKDGLWVGLMLRSIWLPERATLLV